MITTAKAIYQFSRYQMFAGRNTWVHHVYQLNLYVPLSIPTHGCIYMHIYTRCAPRSRVDAHFIVTPIFLLIKPKYLLCSFVMVLLDVTPTIYRCMGMRMWTNPSPVLIALSTSITTPCSHKKRIGFAHACLDLPFLIHTSSNICWPHFYFISMPFSNAGSKVTCSKTAISQTCSKAKSFFKTSIISIATPTNPLSPQSTTPSPSPSIS